MGLFKKNRILKIEALVSQTVSKPPGVTEITNTLFRFIFKNGQQFI